MRTTQQLLFLCLCSVTSCGFTQTQLHGSGVTIVVPEGSDVILPCSPTTKQNLELKIFDWKRDGTKDVFLYDAGIHYNNENTGQDEQFRGRVFHFKDELKNGNASIMIRNTKMADSGNYTCYFPRLQPRETFLIRLVVGSGVTIVVLEGSDVILPCSPTTKQNLELKIFDWKKDDTKKVFYHDAGNHYNNGFFGQDEQFRGRVFHFEDELKNGNASIGIRNTKMADSGVYTCLFPRLQPQETFFIRLVVGAPRLSIITLNQTNDWSLLQCEVRAGSPKPKVEWQDAAGNRIPSEEPQESRIGGHYYITLLANVTKTGYYHCVVEQEIMSHRTDAETCVFYSGKQCEGLTSKVVTGWIGGWFLGVLTLVAVLALLVVTNVMTMPRFKGRHRQRDVPPDGSFQEPLKKDPVQ